MSADRSPEQVIREALTAYWQESPKGGDALAALDALIARCEQAEQALREIAGDPKVYYHRETLRLREIARAALDAQPADQRSRREA